MKTKSFAFSQASIFFLLFFLFPFYLFAQVVPAYAVTSATRLVKDADSRALGDTDQIPLILIHGFTGTDENFFDQIDGSTAEEKEYFRKFLEFFYTTQQLNETYDLYRFHYLSNVVDNPTLAYDLLLWIEDKIEASKFPDKKFVIIAHSMGGTISRSYMEEHTHQIGVYKGRKGGDRVEALITLGTPHHGSPAANDTARDAGDPGWNGLLGFIDTIFWQGIGITEPNRSDLRWDNYNNLSPEYETEKNQWLFDLNNNSDYSKKIIAYYGGVYDATGTALTDQYTYKALWEQLISGSSTDFQNLYLVCESSGILPSKNNLLYPYRGPYNADKPFDMRIKLCFTGVLLKKIYGETDNDGLVPSDSGRFEQGNVKKRVWFEGYDHWDLKSEPIDKPGKIFPALQKELKTIAATMKQASIHKVLVDLPAQWDAPLGMDENASKDVDPGDAVFNLQKAAGLRN